MGGGDLNLKKSWHPSTFHNRKKLWEAEEAEAKEKKILEQLKKEKKAEKDREEFRNVQKKSGVYVSNEERLDWIYNETMPDISASLNEDIILGKKVENVQSAFTKSPISTFKKEMEKEVRTKICHDPLFKIKQKEKECINRVSKKSRNL